jgi:hypothetical protein
MRSTSNELSTRRQSRACPLTRGRQKTRCSVLMTGGGASRSSLRLTCRTMASSTSCSVITAITIVSEPQDGQTTVSRSRTRSVSCTQLRLSARVPRNHRGVVGSVAPATPTPSDPTISSLIATPRARQSAHRSDTRLHLSTTQAAPGIAGRLLPSPITRSGHRNTRAPKSAGVEFRLRRGQSRGKLICAWAAASRAMGTRNGEQLT